MLLTRNTVYIVLNQFLSIIIPIFTLKYVVSIVDNQQFGVIVLYTMIFSYLGMLIEFGFGLSSTRELILVKEDVKRSSEIYSSVVILKILFFLLANLILFFVFFFEDVTFNKYVLLSGVLVLFNRIFDNFWVFQVFNKVGIHTFISFISKILYPIVIFACLKSKDNFWLVLLVPGILNFLSNIIYVYIIRNKIGLFYFFPGFQKITAQLKLASSFFWSIFFSNIYTSLSFIFLGFFASPNEISLIGSADRLIQPIKAGFSAVSLSLFPDFNTMFKKNYKCGFKNVFKYAKIFAFGILIFSTVLSMNAEKIYHFFYGYKLDNGIALFRILVYLPGIVFLGNIFGVQGLLSIKKELYYLKVIILAAILSVLFNFLLVPKYLTMAYTFILISIESLVMILFFIKILKLSKYYEES